MKLFASFSQFTNADSSLFPFCCMNFLSNIPVAIHKTGYLWTHVTVHDSPFISIVLVVDNSDM